jgi:hypothetical protein
MVPTTGGTTSTGCNDLSCLAGHRLLYQPTRVWNHKDLTAWDPPESDFVALDNASPYLIRVSANGSKMGLAEVVSTRYPDPSGSLAKQATTSVEYSLQDGWTGESVIVSKVAGGLEGDLTYFGSGVPIVDKTRGPVTLTSQYDNQSDLCGLPLGVISDGFPATYDDALASGAGCGDRCAGLRNAYCKGNCAGYLVWEDRCWVVPVSIAYDPQTHGLVGYAWGDESAAICRGHFPPPAADGSKGWDLTRLDIALACD